MNKFTFKCVTTPDEDLIDTRNNTEIVYCLDQRFEDLDDVLLNFQNFLKGCGFIFEGHIGIIDVNGDTELSLNDLNENYYGSEDILKQSSVDWPYDLTDINSISLVNSSSFVNTSNIEITNMNSGISLDDKIEILVSER